MGAVVVVVVAVVVLVVAAAAVVVVAAVVVGDKEATAAPPPFDCSKNLQKNNKHRNKYKHARTRRLSSSIHYMRWSAHSAAEPFLRQRSSDRCYWMGM